MISNEVKKNFRKLSGVKYKMFFVVFFLAAMAGLLFSTPSLVEANVLVNASFEDGYGVYKSHYGGTEVVSDSTAPDGTHSLRFNFWPNFPAGNAPDIVSHASISDQEEVYMQYYVKYSSNWVDEPLTNKMVYIWFGDHYDKPNLPVMGHSQWDSKGVWAVLQAGGTIPQQSWHSYDYINNFNFTYGVWHKIVIRLKMNTAGNHNGIFQVWVDGTQVIDASNGYFRNAGENYGFTNLSLTPVYGGGINTNNPQMYMWFDDVIVQTTPIDESTTPPAQSCGDGTCNNGETSSSCSQDCPAPTPTGDTTPPPMPGSVTITPSSTNETEASFQVAWSASIDQPSNTAVSKYTYTAGYNDGESPQSGTAGTNSTMLAMPYHSSNTAQTAYFCVKAEDSTGNVSTDQACNSFTVNAKTLTTPPPAKTYTLADFTNLVADWLKSMTSSPADTNLDGRVDSKDLGIMMSNWAL